MRIERRWAGQVRARGNRTRSRVDSALAAEEEEGDTPDPAETGDVTRYNYTYSRPLNLMKITITSRVIDARIMTISRGSSNSPPLVDLVEATFVFLTIIQLLSDRSSFEGGSILLLPPAPPPDAPRHKEKSSTRRAYNLVI